MPDNFNWKNFWTTRIRAWLIKNQVGTHLMSKPTSDLFSTPPKLHTIHTSVLYIYIYMHVKFWKPVCLIDWTESYWTNSQRKKRGSKQVPWHAREKRRRSHAINASVKLDPSILFHIFLIFVLSWLVCIYLSKRYIYNSRRYGVKEFFAIRKLNYIWNYKF